MKSEELRIGNILIEKYTGDILVVSELTKNRITFDYQTTDKWQAEPIPLSEEVLLKCPQLDKKTGKYGDYFFGVSHELLRIWFNERWIIGKKVEGVEYNTVIVSSNINYLHQLQNIFTLLTKEELEVSL